MTKYVKTGEARVQTFRKVKKSFFDLVFEFIGGCFVIFIILAVIGAVVNG